MTDEEIKKWQKYKSQIVKSVQKKRAYYESSFKNVYETDERLSTYIFEVIDNPSQHNLYEILGVRRFFAMLEKYEWKPKRVQRFVKFFQTLKFSGINGRQRYKLTPVQVFQFANIYGFAKEDGRRLIRNAYLFVPRKFSKTTSCAAMAVYDMLFGDNNAQAYVGANSYDQAKICFDEIRNIMYDLDGKSKHFKVNREKITFKNHERDSLIQCLTANAKTKDGLFASLVIMDEYAQARNTASKNGADLKNVLTTSMGPRREPLTIIITTASDVVDGPFAHELDGVLKVLRGEADNDTMFASIFMPDVDDQESDPRTWRKVQPHLGITVQPDYYENEWQSAQLSAENLTAFRTKLLNRFASNEKVAWITAEKAKSLLEDFNFKNLTNRPQCMCAFDLSVKDDFSAVAYTCYDRPSKKFYSEVFYYFPAGQLETHPNRELYKRWVEDGHLILCEGDCIDYQQIGNDILEMSKKLRIVQIGYDAYKAPDLVAMLGALGGKNALKPYPQTYGAFNMPVESFELMAFNNPTQIALNNNPINAYCLSNAVVDEDRLGNRKIVKPSINRKIDGAICVLMTIGMFNRN